MGKGFKTFTLMVIMYHRLAPRVHYFIETVPHLSLTITENIRDFSAVCWFYGKRMFGSLNYPIGLIASAVGGTRIEAWSSPDALEQCFPDGPPP